MLLLLEQIKRLIPQLAIIALLVLMGGISRAQSLEELQKKLHAEDKIAEKSRILLQITAEEIEQGQYTRAIQSAKKNIALTRDSTDNPELLGEAFLGLARAYFADKQYEEAVRSYFEAIGLISEHDSERLWVAYEELGILYQSWQGYEKAASYFRKSLGAMPENNKQAAARLLEKLANAYSALQNYDSAIPFYQKLLALHQQQGHKDRAREVYYHLAVGNEMLGKHEQALQYAEAYLAETKEQKADDSIVKALNTLGFLKRKMKEGKASKAYFQRALDHNQALADKAKPSGKAALLTNTGVINANLRDYGKALESFEKALELRKSENNREDVAKLYNHIATTYFLRGDLIQSKSVAEVALEQAQSIDAPAVQQETYRILANISEATGNFEAYQNYTRQFQEAKDKVFAKRNEREQAMVSKKFIIEQLESRLKLTLSEAKQQKLAAENAEKEKELAQSKAEQAEQARKLQQARAEQAEKERQLAKARAEQAVQGRLLAEQRAENERKEKELANARAAEALIEAQKAEQARELAVARANEAKAEQEKKLEAQERQNEFRILLSILAFVVITLGLISIFFIRNRKKNRLLAQQNEKIQDQNDDLQHKNAEISAQRDTLSVLNKDLNQKSEEIAAQRDAIESEMEKSDQLLLNILPMQTARELKENGRATPKQYKQATVLFTDFKGFTGLAERLTPEQVIEELNYCFIAFDEILARNNMEKIKTIGDAYMAVGGVPIANDTNPTDAVRAGLEIQEFAKEWARQKEAKGVPPWEIRLGIHTGSLIAGVVGKSKFAYDIWGDTVNLASRMETGGEVGKVNISGTTYQYVKEEFSCVYRGKVEAKNKGDVDMYFVEKPKSHPSQL